MKNDKYRRARGGQAQMISVICVKCQGEVLAYQKDGKGQLLRCYLNRIESPIKYSELDLSDHVKQPSDMPNLICTCGELIGTPMRHHDGRLAFRLIRGKYLRRKRKSERKN